MQNSSGNPTDNSSFELSAELSVELPGELLSLATAHLSRLRDTHDLTLTESQIPRLLQLFGLSDFIADSCQRDPSIIALLLSDTTYPNFSAQLGELATSEMTEEQMKSLLREYRRKWMTVIAAKDLLNAQSIETSLLQVSALADALIMCAYDWSYTHYCQRYGMPLGEFGAMPMLILGMGKLGGRELNFSSDIDLIFFYPERGEIDNGRKPVEHQVFFIRVAQKLIALLDQVTADGQVFRVDMRLRPFGDSGPLVMHFAAMEDYYQEQGREWERYAMVKGRVLNPDCPYFNAVRGILAPFVYRRYLDYGAIESLRKMKQLINQEVRRRQLASNVKLGRGGIREAEFIVQSFQLIRGGKDQDLRHPSLLHNLQQLQVSNLLNEDEAINLKSAYLHLRKIEHCLQQFQDKQTQSLPDNHINWQRLLHVMKTESESSFRDALHTSCDSIHTLFTEIIGVEHETEQAPSPALTASRDLWLLDISEHEACEILAEWLDVKTAADIHHHLKVFSNHTSKHRMGQRGADLLAVVVPQLLEMILLDYSACAGQLTQRVVGVLNAIVGRTAYLELLCENRGAAGQLLRLCAASPWITEQIQRFPMLLDELLNPQQLYTPTPPLQFTDELRQYLLRIEPDDLEQQMEMMRQFKLGQQLKIAASDVTGALPLMKISDHLTYLAEALLQQAFVYAWQQVTSKHGSPPDCSAEHSNFAIIGYGKLGGIELGYGSDLDLVFLHNNDYQGTTDGKRPIDTNKFYLKLAQRIMHLLNTKTVFGQLYEVDLRLRPSGNSGLLVCHISAFEHYQMQDAWTWEHQALVRARCILGDHTLVSQFNDIRTAVLCKAREQKALSNDVSTMREKMRQHLAGKDKHGVDLKHTRGGIVDIEFLVQYWVLLYANSRPEIVKWSDNVRLLESLQVQKFIDEMTCELLIEAYLVFRNEAHRLALQHREWLEPSTLLRDLQKRVRKIWSTVFEPSSIED